MASYRLTPEARRDLFKIGDFTERKWGRLQRRRYLDQLDRRMAFLAEHPKIGSPRPEIRPDLRSFREASHLIFYEETDDGILVARVLHERVQLSRWLRGER